MSPIQEDARRFLGLAPFDGPENSCRSDGYFWIGSERKYGVREWVAAVRQLGGEVTAHAEERRLRMESYRREERDPYEDLYRGIGL